MDPSRLPLLPPDHPTDETAEENPIAVDDGDARHECSPPPLVRVARGVAQALTSFGSGEE